jgi:pSer/pThr/pTyr-binding forkhead associated (FHA) protein
MGNSDNDSTILVDMDEVLSLQSGKPLRLRQVAGPGEGRSFRVLRLQEAIIGREETALICLDEKSVSRRHAKIDYKKTFPEVVDLGSANGTFVNGKRVDKALLRDGDSLQVGAGKFEIDFHANADERADSSASHGTVSPEELKRIERALDSSWRKLPRLFGHRTAFTGELEDIGLMSVLQTLGANRATGTLIVRDESGEGSVYFDKGELGHATLADASGPKALYRLLALEKGQFSFYTPGRKPEMKTLDGGLDHHLLEGARQLDELSTYRDQLPEATDRLSFNPNVMVNLSRVPSPVLDVLAAIGQVQIMSKVMDTCQLTDLDICRILLMLMQKTIVVATHESVLSTAQMHSPIDAE